MGHSGIFCEQVQLHPERIEAVRGRLPPAEQMARAAGLFKAMGDGTRLRIVWALTQAELCVCDLSALLGMSVSAVSHQLAFLRNVGLVTGQRRGKEVFYTLADGHVRALLIAGMDHAAE